MTIEPDLLARIDQARGATKRSAWIARALENATLRPMTKAELRELINFLAGRDF